VGESGGKLSAVSGETGRLIGEAERLWGSGRCAVDELRGSENCTAVVSAGVSAGNLKAGGGGEVCLNGVSSWSSKSGASTMVAAVGGLDDRAAAVNFPAWFLSCSFFDLLAGMRVINERDPGRFSISQAPLIYKISGRRLNFPLAVGSNCTARGFRFVH
jgi:hypothetical protein